MQGHIVLKPDDFVSITVSTTSVALADPPTGIVKGILTVESADIRMRADGTAPVGGAGGGLPMVDGSVWEIDHRDWFVDMRFIRDSDTDAVLSVHYVWGG